MAHHQNRSATGGGRAAGDSDHVRAVVSRIQAMSRRLDWLTTANQRAGS
jgi:hypothetical protein